MFEALIAWFVATFLLGPLQAGIAERLEAARAPSAIMRQVSDCAASEAPRAIERAASDPVWAIGTAFGVWVGSTAPEAALREAAPGCAPAIEAARPYLRG